MCVFFCALKTSLKVTYARNFPFFSRNVGILALIRPRSFVKIALARSLSKSDKSLSTRFVWRRKSFTTNIRLKLVKLSNKLSLSRSGRAHRRVPGHRVEGGGLFSCWRGDEALVVGDLSCLSLLDVDRFGSLVGLVTARTRGTRHVHVHVGRGRRLDALGPVRGRVGRGT